jgi:hypothetical protein
MCKIIDSFSKKSIAGEIKGGVGGIALDTNLRDLIKPNTTLDHI